MVPQLLQMPVGQGRNFQAVSKGTVHAAGEEESHIHTTGIVEDNTVAVAIVAGIVEAVGDNPHSRCRDRFEEGSYSNWLP